MSAEQLHDETEENASGLVEIHDEDGAHGHQDTEGVWLISYADMMTLLMGFFALMASMSSIDESKFKEVGNEAALYFGGDVIEPFEKVGKAISKLIKDKGLEKEVNIRVEKTGIIITFEGTLFFTSGSYKLKSDANALMQELLKVLNEKAHDKKFVIEGHTDNTPINRGVIASNWELSSLRANAVARLFEKYDFHRDQILTIGLGETRPILPNKNALNQPLPKNQAQNRRVVIKVLDKHPL